MLAARDCVLVVLAAGLSRRFGGGKLDEDLLGLPLGLHVAAALEDMAFGARVAVTGDADPGYARYGFAVVANPDRTSGMASSVRLGVEHAIAVGAGSVLVALADMPRIGAAHVARLFEASEGAMSVVASSDGDRAMPPALFGARHFPELRALEGDAGARALIRGGSHVVTTPAELVDIDTAEELDRLRAHLHDLAGR